MKTLTRPEFDNKSTVRVENDNGLEEKAMRVEKFDRETESIPSQPR